MWGHLSIYTLWYIMVAKYTTIIVSYKVVLLPYSSVPPSHHPVATDLHAISIVLPFPQCHVVDAVHFIVFSYRILSLSNVHLFPPCFFFHFVLFFLGFLFVFVFLLFVFAF